MLTNSVSREELRNALLTARPALDGKKLYIWGTGNTALLYQEGLKRLEKEGFYITGYCDNNMQKFNSEKYFCGKVVLSLEELKREKEAFVMICTPQPRVIKEVMNQLNELKIPYLHIDEVIFKMHAEELLYCYDALEDMDSKNLYAYLILCRMKGIYPQNIAIDRNQYFTLERFWNQNATEIFIDCGAFVGDVLERYIWNKGGVFGKIIAFEPDKNNYQALVYRTKRLIKEWNLKNENIEIKFAGVGASNGGGGGYLCKIKRMEEWVQNLWMEHSMGKYAQSALSILA